MPHHDNEPLPDVPEMVPDRDDFDSYQRKQIKPKSKARASDNGDTSPRSGSGPLVYIFGIVAVAAAAWAGYLHTQLLSATERVVALEERLSTTDQSVNQSSVALQVKIQEVDAAVAQLRDETLKKMSGQIDRQSAQIAAVEKSAKSTQAALTATDQRVSEQNKTLDSTRAQIDKTVASIDASKQKIDQHQASIDSLSNKVKSVNDAQAKLDSRLSNNEEWVESINTFRKQMNREIVNIKQQVAGGKPAAGPAEIQ